MSSSPFELDQADLAARLTADPYFSDITVETLRPRANAGFAEIQSRIDQALSGLKAKAGKVGAAVHVLMPFADVESPVAPGPMMNVDLVARVQEFPLHNMGARGTGKSCEEIALKVTQLFHHFNSGRGYVFFCAREFWTPSAVAAPLVTIDVRVTHKGGIVAAAKVARPTISSASLAVPQEVTLATATAGASIYYTTDDSYPSSANDAAVLYSAPFTVTEAGTLSVAAEKSGLTQSDVVKAIFT